MAGDDITVERTPDSPVPVVVSAAGLAVPWVDDSSPRLRHFDRNLNPTV